MSNPTIAETIPANPLGAFEYRQLQIANITTIIAAEADLPTDAVEWRDAFCHECEGSACLNGTARQLAEKVFDLGWAIENLKLGNLICPKCQDIDPVVDAFWAEAEGRYDRWKDSRFEN